jgi:hypothetical protein
VAGEFRGGEAPMRSRSGRGRLTRGSPCDTSSVGTGVSSSSSVARYTVSTITPSGRALSSGASWRGNRGRRRTAAIAGETADV